MPIISPWIFYLIDLLSNLGVILIIVAFITLFVGVILFIISVAMPDDEEIYNRSLKTVKQMIIIGAVSTVMAFFVPSQETMYKMLVANYVTDENIETATDAIKDGVDYIFEKLDEEE